MNDLSQSNRLIEEMNAYYERRARWHDRYMSYESGEAMEALLEPIVKAIEGYIHDKAVLEIACGTGNWTEVLAKRARSVMAIDVSPTALDIAQTKVASYKNISLKLADAYTLDGVNGLFNVAFAADWWSHIPRHMIHSFLERVTEKLAPGSKMVFIDMCMNEHFRDEPCSYDDHGNRVSLRRLPDGSEFRVVKNFPTQDELIAVLTRHGSNVVYQEFDSLKRWMVACVGGPSPHLPHR